MQFMLWLPHLFGDVLYVQVAPPVFGHRLDGRELGYPAVVVGRRQLRHREADDPQRLAHCAAPSTVCHGVADARVSRMSQHIAEQGIHRLLGSDKDRTKLR